jgi:hypothetical protein
MLRKVMQLLSSRVWVFPDPPETAVITSQGISSGDDWIYYVSRAIEDGGWQFLPHSGAPDEREAVVTALKRIVILDTTVNEIADLKCGWCAWRDGPGAAWQRAEISSL